MLSIGRENDTCNIRIHLTISGTKHSLSTGQKRLSTSIALNLPEFTRSFRLIASNDHDILCVYQTNAINKQLRILKDLLRRTPLSRHTHKSSCLLVRATSRSTIRTRDLIYEQVRSICNSSC